MTARVPGQRRLREPSLWVARRAVVLMIVMIVAVVRAGRRSEQAESERRDRAEAEQRERRERVDRERERAEDERRESAEDERRERAENELEVDLRLAQKLEAVGQLAAGIAHEINTPIQFVSDTNRFLDNAFADVLTVLDAYGELLAAAQSGEIPPGLIRRVEEAEEAADIPYLRDRIPDAFVRSFDGINRVTKIVSAMRSFAHPPTLETSLVDINDAIRNTLIVATNEYKYVADVRTDLGELPPVACNAGDINQVLLNLLINAADAIAEVVGESAERGRITVRTWSAGRDVWISIADTGPGIPPENADRVFDPFFTTKEAGRGTGHGLAICRSVVVERHRGSLSFESAPGEGTTFLIRLPAHGLSASMPTAVAA